MKKGNIKKFNEVNELLFDNEIPIYFIKIDKNKISIICKIGVIYLFLNKAEYTIAKDNRIIISNRFDSFYMKLKNEIKK